MANKIPPVPIGSAPGSAFWNDWYEKLRNLINSGTISQLWSSLDFTASNITDIVTRNHNNLQGFQGGTTGEYYHMTNAFYNFITNTAQGTYTPTLFNTTNVAASTAYACQYQRVGSMVTVSGQIDLDPTAVGNTILGISIPVTSAFATSNNLGGTASSFVNESAAIYADVANGRAALRGTVSDVSNHAFYFSFSYLVI